MFSHDPSTNRLSLLGEPPWIADDNGAWNYCVDCWERFFSMGEKAVQTIPFRDKASQANMVVSWRDRKRKAEELSHDEIDPPASQNSQAAGLEAEPGVAGIGAAAEGDESNVVDDEIFQQHQELPDSDDDKNQPEIGDAEPPNLPKGPTLEAEEAEEETFNDGGQVLLPTERRPTLQEYKAKWASLLAEHSRAIEGNFSADNLCPKPIHQLWNDCGGLMLKRALKVQHACCRTNRCLQPRPLRSFPPIDFAGQSSSSLRL